MMHGHEKSDSVIVAAKPANKAVQSAVEQSAGEPAVAEPGEPRAETKGNADQQSTCRAQSRVSVSQALDRIRKVAKERKKEKFTALFHHISTDLLEEAFYELKENAAPGVDRLTWKDYEADLERKLEDLHDRVQRGAYRALPSRRVYIPKPDGRQRPLAVNRACAGMGSLASTEILRPCEEPMTGQTKIIDFHNHHIPARFELTATRTQPATQRARWEMLARKLPDENLLLSACWERTNVLAGSDFPIAGEAPIHGPLTQAMPAGRPFRCPTGRHRCGQLPAAAWRRRNIGSSQCLRTCWR
jgi:hypothetical protein